MTYLSWRKRFWVLAIAIGGLAFGIVATGCGAGGTYQRVSPDGSGGDVGAGGESGTSGGGRAAQGGAVGSGGMVATGGIGSGGTSNGGKGGAGGSGTAGAAGAGGKAGGAGGGVGGGGAGGGGAAGGAGVGGSPMGGKGGGGTGGTAVGGGGAGGGKAGMGGGGAGGSAVGGGGAGGGGRGGMGGAMTTILSIDFVGGVGSGGAGGTTMTMKMAATETAGVRPAMNWNAATGAASTAALTPLVLSDGTSSTASVTWSAPGTATSSGIYSVGLTDMAGDTRMMNGYLDPAMGTNPSATVTVSGLPTALGSYDVYVYFMAKLSSGETRVHTLKVVTTASTSFQVSQTGPSPTTFPGYTLAAGTTGNYVIFKKQTGATFTLTSTAVSGSTLRAPINGLQIVWPAGP